MKNSLNLIKGNNLNIQWNEEKNQNLQNTRKIGFEKISNMIKKRDYITIIANDNYLNQDMFILNINEYIWCVPFVIGNNGTVFLKTAYPSRKHNKIYNIKG